MGEPWGIGNTVGATSGVAGPGAGAVIVSLAAPPAGTYKIDVMITYANGVVGVAERNNMEFRAGATVVTSLVIPDFSNSGFVFTSTFRRALDGATALSVNATAAGTATAIYLAQIIATRIL